MCMRKKLRFKQYLLWIALITTIWLNWSLRDTKLIEKIKISMNVTKKRLVLPYVVVHLDLKGTPLKLSYLESLLPALRASGANGLLIEYEDMFPYHGKLANLSAGNCYNLPALQRFLILAKTLGFEIIPLVQTFGHMEHVLKLAEFQHLREDRRYPDSICPSNAKAFMLLKQMLKQVIHFHKSILPLKFIHIGCDEVFHLKKCLLCLKRNLLKEDIFLQHVRAVSSLVKSLHHNMTILIWDDMMRPIKLNHLKNIDFDNVQPVYWDYAPNLIVPKASFTKYQKKFGHIWVASAYKGADGRVALIPKIRDRVYNTISWMELLLDYKKNKYTKYDFRGIILTGWSRYTHMDPPCEMLPVAYPSLIFNLLLVKKYKIGSINRSIISTGAFDDIVNEYFPESGLDCSFESGSVIEEDCKFDGHELYRALVAYSNLAKELSTKDDNLILDLIDYYSKMSYINTNIISKYIKTVTLKLEALTAIRKWLTKEIEKFYDRDFATEYVNYKTSFYKHKLEKALISLKNYSKVKTWTRRIKSSQKLFK